MFSRLSASTFTLSILVVGSPATATPASFADTTAFSKEPKGLLNVKFSLHAKMQPTPKGTACDWVFLDPAFDLAGLKQAGLNLTVAEFAAHEGMSNDIAGLTQNPVVDTFRRALGTMGIRTRMPAGGVVAQDGTPMAQMAALSRGGGAPSQAPTRQFGMAMLLKANPAALDQMVNQRLTADAAGNQAEKDRYEADKAKLSLEEAAQQAQTRQEARKAAIRAELLGEAPAPAPTKPVAPVAEVPPDQRPGYQLIIYVLADKGTHGALALTGLNNNSTTAEFLLLRDGHPVLAGRHQALRVTLIGSGNASGAKCGEALATAFLAQP